MTTERPDLHVVLGTGPLGLAVARRLAASGRAVKAVNRRGRATLPAEVEVVAADAMSAAAADFFGPHVLESHMGERVFARALDGRPASVIGNPDVPHTYTFIDDFAAGLVTLAGRDEALGGAWHIPNDETVTARAFIARIFAEIGAEPGVRAMPRPLLPLLAAFSPTLRAVREVAYQLEQPYVVDHTKFTRAFGAQPTPKGEAIRQTIAWYRDR